MMEVMLPFLPGDTSLSEALDRMHAGHVGGVVTERPNGPFLLRDVDLFERWNAAVDAGEDPALVKLGRIVPRAAPTRMPDRLRRLDLDVSILGDEVRRSEAEEIFSAANRSYSIIAVTADRAKVLTASEAFGGPLQYASAVWACEGQPVHYWKPAQLRDPTRCNMPHRARVRQI